MFTHSSFYKLVTFVLILFSSGVHGQEICDNGIDDDGDLLIDLNDTTECSCDTSFIGLINAQSIIPNPNFDEVLSCPTIVSQMENVAAWYQATAATPDFFNACGSFYSPYTPAPLPVSSDSSFTGGAWLDGYKEYIGTCLNSPLQSGITYLLEMDVAGVLYQGEDISSVFEPPIPNNGLIGDTELTVYGLSSCPGGPVGGFDYGCPVPYGWTAIASASVALNNQWQELSMTFTPTFDVESIMIGAPCDYGTPWPPATDSILSYFYYDNIQLNVSESNSSTVISENGSICTADYELIVQLDSVAGTYQWYQHGIALLGQNDTILDFSGLSLEPDTFQFKQTLGLDSCVIYDIIVDPPPDLPDVEFFGYIPLTFPQPPTLEGCVPYTVGFIQPISPALNITSLIWDFGNGDQAADESPIYTFTEPGSYDITLTITTLDGCTVDTTYFDYVIVEGFPEVSFSSDVTESCSSELIAFTNNSATLGTICQWDFGNGQTSNNCSPTVSFSDPGSYDVQLTLTSPLGCSNDSAISNMITILPSPELDFDIGPPSGCAPFAVDLNNLTSNVPITNCLWDFGDGEGSIDCTVNHIYTNPGIFDLSLSVESDLGCLSDTILTAYIEVDAVPEVNFSSDLSEGCVPENISFLSASSSVVAECSWNFGPLGVSSLCAPEILFDEAGTYDVQLTLSSPLGCVNDSVFLDAITIYPTPLPNLIADTLIGCTPLSTSFFNLTNNIPFANCLWDFGDGETSTECNPVHTYNSSGIYDVMLNIESEFGCLADTLIPSYIVVGGPSKPIIVAEPDIGCAPLEVTFALQDNNEIPISNVQWQLSDSSSINDLFTFNHTFFQTGVIDVSVNVTDEVGCVNDSTYIGFIEVLEPPTAAFIFSPDTLNVYNNEAEFTDLSERANSWFWDFGNNTFSTDQSPMSTYVEPGEYEVTLIIDSEEGCTDSISSFLVYENEVLAYIPNAFSPNGDGINDLFQTSISGADPNDYELKIYDRWGQVVFQTNDISGTWNGSYQSTYGEKRQEYYVPSGIYVWQMSLKEVKTSDIKQIRGHLTVIR